MQIGYSQFDTTVEDMSRHPETGANFHYVENPSPSLSPDASWRHYFVRDSTSLAFSIVVPFWFPILMSAVIGGLSWLPFRFTLRTLLIATTLVAVGLGLIVWAARAR